MIADIEKAKREAEEFAPEAAQWEAEFQDLKRREPIVLAKCISKIPSGNMAERKNSALQDPEYSTHLDEMNKAQFTYLKAEKGFRTVIEYIKAITSENYKENAKIKAGI